MTHRVIFALVPALALAACCLTAAQAATINVPGDQPTVAAAVGVATSGDVIVLASGLHTESLSLDGATNDIPAELTLQGSGLWSTVWDAGGAGPCLGVTDDQPVSWHLVDLAFTGAAGGIAAVNIAVTGGGTWTVEDCRFFAGGTSLLRSTADVEVSGSLFVDTEGVLYVGAIAAGGTMTVTSCTFDNLDVGAQVLGGAAMDFSACIFSNLDTKGLNFGGTVGWDCICEFAIAASGNFPAGTNILTEDPQFCGVTGIRDWSLQNDSPCLADPTCGLVGARGAGCLHVPNEGLGWGALKALYR